jgi:hypothetical protein
MLWHEWEAHVGGINTGRWLAGGVVAGILIWIVEGAASLLYASDMQTILQAHGLSMDMMNAQAFLLTIAISLLVGLTLVFFYAAARPRLGPGPKTAVTVAVVLWCGGYLASLLGYQMLGLFPVRMLVLWGTVGLGEMIVAALVGGWIYRES